MFSRIVRTVVACGLLALFGHGVAEARPSIKGAPAPERHRSVPIGKGAQHLAALRRAETPVRRGRAAGRVALRAAESGRPSIGQVIGLHLVDDPLDLKSAVAVVADPMVDEVLFEKNSNAVLPIASITKLMTAMVTLDAQLPMGETLEVTEADIDTEKFSRSRLRPGSRLTRAEMMNLALMASENRAASALGRHYPGGLPAFVDAMNHKARSLGMTDTRFVDPTGLSSQNVSNARDLVKMVRAAAEYPTIRQYSTATGLTVDTGLRMVSFRSTNRLVDSPTWDIALQKTGYINEAGNCLVMQVTIEGRPLIMVLLDAAGRHSRYADAARLKHWLESASPRTTAAAPAGVLRASHHGRFMRPRTALGS